MGIPQFKRHLEPYTQRAAIEPGDVVLDGPALAYHVLALCSRATRKTSPFEQPSYELLGKVAVAWLEKIQACGLSVVAIYFDGYLPDSKRAERIQRLIKSSRDLIKYHSAFLAGVPPSNPHHAVDGVVDLFPNAWPGEKKAKPPPPPFLVPAVIDALRESPKFGPRVELVPGEADGFCADHVRRHGGTILTSDSDLLVHDLGEAGAVVFFADVDADPQTERLIAPQYQSRTLCRRLSIQAETGLQRIAFEVSRDPHLTLQQAVERAKKSGPSSAFPEEYSDFIKQYHSPEVSPNLKTDWVVALDPRVSEIVLRSLAGLEIATGVSEPGSQVGNGLEVYLPFLLDCPSRTSAWEASKPLRQLAYALLLSNYGSSIPSISEMRRMQSISSGTQVDVPGPAQVDELGNSLLALLSKLEAGVSKAELIWPLLSIYHDIVMTLNRARGYPLSLDILDQEARGTLDERSWEFIHFLAQTQAVCYSLRMLLQILQFSARSTGTLSATMSALAKLLSRLPSLADFPSPRTFAETLRVLREAEGLSCLRSLCADYKDIIQHIQAIGKPKNIPRSKKNRSTTSAEVQTRSRSTNPFDLLASSGE